MSQMQATERTQRSTVDNLIILNSIIENQRQNKIRIYLFFPDAKKYFSKLRLKDCLIEMYYLAYSTSAIKSLHEINKSSDTVVDTPVGKTSIKHNCGKEMKQGTIFGPIMCYASTSRVNAIQDTVKYQNGKVEISMSVFMDDIAAVETSDNSRKRIQKCRRMKIEKKDDT